MHEYLHNNVFLHQVIKLLSQNTDPKITTQLLEQKHFNSFTSSFEHTFVVICTDSQGTSKCVSLNSTIKYLARRQL